MGNPKQNQHILDWFEAKEQAELKREWEAHQPPEFDERPEDAAMEQWYINCRDAINEFNES